jgi:hypothetical protein
MFGSSQMGGVQAADAYSQGRTLDWVLDHQCTILQTALQKRISLMPSVFICGLPGAMVSDHYLISKSLFPLATPRLVIVTLAPRDFIDNFLPDISATEPYKFFSRYLADDPHAHKLLFDNWNATLQNTLDKAIPIKNAAQFVSWKSLANCLPAKAAQKGSDTTSKATGWMFSLNSDNDNVKPGQCVVLPNMPNKYIDNSVEYAKRYRNCNPSFYKK